MRVWWENINPKHHGTNSLLEQAVEELVSICIQMGKIRQALSVLESIELINSLIAGTHLQNNVATFQMEWKLYRENSSYGKVGQGWWRGFLQRNGHRIVSQ